MYSNTLDTFVRSAVHGKAIMIIHRVTGGYLTQNGDLQIESDDITKITNERHLWSVRLVGYRKNNTVFTFENKSSGRVLSVDEKDPRGPMTYTERQEPDAQGSDPKAAERQQFFVLPLCCGGYSLVPVKYPGHCLQPKDNRPGPGSHRPAPYYGRDSSLDGSHDFVLAPTQPPRKDPTDRDLDNGNRGGGSDGDRGSNID